MKQSHTHTHTLELRCPSLTWCIAERTVRSAGRAACDGWIGSVGTAVDSHTGRSPLSTPHTLRLYDCQSDPPDNATHMSDQGSDIGLVVRTVEKETGRQDGEH